MKKSSVIVILIAFALGIIVQNNFQIHWVLVSTLLALCCVNLFLLTNWKKYRFELRNWINGIIITVFFFAGMASISFHSDESLANHFSSKYLKGDHLIGEIVDYQNREGEYDRAIVQVVKVVRQYSHRQEEVQGKLLCYVKIDKQSYNIGDVIYFQPNVYPIKNKNNPYEFNAEQYWKTKNVRSISFVNGASVTVLESRFSFTGFWLATRSYLEEIIKKHISDENQGLVIALTLGNKSDLSQEVRTNFANAGAMHVLAVSGMHIGILLVFIQWVFRQFNFLRKKNLYLYFAILFLWCFALVTGMSASVVRAVSMFTLLGVGQLLGKQYFSLQGIAGSALILLLFNPYYLYDIGFQLSYLAVVGISLFYRPILSLFHSKYKLIKWLWEGTAIGIAAQIGTVPLTLYYFHQFPNYTFLANIGVMVFSAAALVSVVILLMISFIPYIVDWIAYLVDLIYTFFNEFITWVNSLPAVTSTGFTPSVIQIILLYGGTLLCFYFWQKRKEKQIKISLVILFVVCLSLIVGREYNSLKDELIILNSNNKVILLKQNRQLMVIYDEAENSSKEDLRYQVQGYAKAMGVQEKYIDIAKQVSMKITPDIIVKNTPQGMFINYYNDELLLIERLPSETDSTQAILIKGRWNPYIKSTKIPYSTEEKAFYVYPT